MSSGPFDTDQEIKAKVKQERLMAGPAAVLSSSLSSGPIDIDQEMEAAQILKERYHFEQGKDDNDKDEKGLKRVVGSDQADEFDNVDNDNDDDIEASQAYSILEEKQNLDRLSHKSGTTAATRAESRVLRQRRAAPKPGAIAVAGLSPSSPTNNDSSSMDNMNKDPASTTDSGPMTRTAPGDDEEGHHVPDSTELHEQTTIVTASVVNEEDEQQKLQQAKDYGREEVLKNAVVAEALVIPPPNQQDSTKNNWKYIMFGLCLFALMVAVAVVVGTVVATRPSDPAAPSPILIVTETIAPTFTPTTRAPAPPTMAPTQFYYNNTYCYSAQPVPVDSFIVTDSQIGKSPQALGVFQPCDDSNVTHGVAGWFSVRGNGRVVSIRVCRCASLLYVATGECTTTSIFQPDHCYLSATTRDLKPLVNGCFQGSWPTVPDVDYYMAVGTVLDAAVTCVNKTFTVALNSNDYCKFAYQIKADGSMNLGSTLNATRDKISPCGAADAASSSAGSNSSNSTSNGVWYTVNGTGQTLTFSTCGSETLSTQLSVYTGACVDQLQCVAAATTDYECDNQTSVSWLSKLGVLYYLMVHGDNSGPFVLTGFQSPPNDLCQGAETISLSSSSSGSSSQYYNGSTIGATFSNDAAYLDTLLSCGLNFTESPGVWYQLAGLDGGLSMSVDTCSSSSSADDNTTPAFHPNLVVIEGQLCEADLTCPENAIYSNACGSPSDAAASSSNRVTWNTRTGETYFLFVYGNSENETGDFVLNITSISST